MLKILLNCVAWDLCKLDEYYTYDDFQVPNIGLYLLQFRSMLQFLLNILKSHLKTSMYFYFYLCTIYLLDLYLY